MRLPSQLWRTYIFICCISMLTAGLMVYFKWQNVLSETFTELQYANSLVFSSSQAMFSQKESLLRIMGERLLELGSLKKPDEAQTLIDQLLSSNPELAGFGLADTSGQLILTSFNIDRSKLPNLLSQEESAKTFKEALKTDRIVVGHTYFMKALNQWIIPLRERITDDKGRVYAVMTTGLKINDINSPWNKKNLPNNIELSIIREDFYRLYSSHAEPDKYPQAYEKAIDPLLVKEFSKQLIKQTGKSFDDLEKGNISLQIFSIDALNRYTAGVISFNNNYRFSVITFKPINLLIKQMLTPVIWIFSLIFVFNLSLYFLFKHNSQLQKKAEDRLKFQAEHDQLTQLPNRYFLNRIFPKWSEEQKAYAILFIDLNNFKTANDLYGHSVGDQILIEVAARIKTAFPDSLHIRQGGDEFTILLTQQESEQAIDKCKQFLYALKYPIRINELVFSIGASIGIARYPQDGKNIEELLRKADITMYDAKNQTSNISLFSKKLDEISKRRSLLEKELEHAIRLNELSMVYQPQVDAKNHQVIGVESLLRWNNATLGFVPPDEFIPIAETTGLIHSIGQFVLNTSIREMLSIHKQLYRDTDKSQILRLSVNISVQQLLNKEFYNSIFSLISQHDANQIQLMFEVTENLFIEDIEMAKSVLTQLQQHNIGISLDDFGTGYSSLSVLSQLPINELKIDKSFVDDILIDHHDLMLIQNIISIGKSMEIQVLAEGVEDIEQIEMLKDSGCDLYQGYYFAKPMNRDDLLDYLLRNL